MQRRTNPLDWNIHRGARKLAREALLRRLAEAGRSASTAEIVATVSIMVDQDPQWLEKATRKVMRRK